MMYTFDEQAIVFVHLVTRGKMDLSKHADAFRFRVTDSFFVPPRMQLEGERRPSARS